MPQGSDFAPFGLPMAQPVEPPEPTDPVEASALDVLKSAFYSENSVGSYLFRREQDRQFDAAQVGEAAPEGYPRPEAGAFDPVQATLDAGMEAYADDLVDSETQMEFDRKVWQIRAEEQNNEVLAQGGWLSIPAIFATAALDPTFLASMAIPGGGATRAARTARQAAQVMIGEAAAESVLQATQETRTGIESALNIGAATFLGGMLGAMRKGMTDVEAERLRNAINFDFATPQARAVGALEAVDPAATIATGMAKLARVPGIKSMSPLTRLMASTSNKAREVAVNLLETPIGGAAGRLATAVETHVKAWQAPKAEAYQQIRRQLKEYKKATPRAQRIKDEEFRIEISRALRRGDTHENAYVAAAAKDVRKVLNRIGKDLEEMGFIDELGEVQFAKSYVPRIYNHVKIRQDYNGFREFLADKFMEGGNLERVEALANADDTIRNILRQNNNNTFGPAAKPGAAKARKLAIADEELEPWLHSDIEYVLAGHIDRTAPMIELQRRFGSVDLADELDAIRDDYAALITGANPARAEKLNKEMDRAIRDIEGARDVLLGTYALPKDPTSAVTQAGIALRKINYLRMLGGMTLSALPDMANFVMRNGLRSNFRVFGQILQDMGRIKMSKADMRRMGVGLDMTLNGRAKAWAEVGDRLSSRAGAALERMSDSFAKVTLMSQWNATMKTWAGFVSQDIILRAGRSLQNGRGISKATRRRLQNLGLDDDMLRRIAQQTDEFGESGGGLVVSRTDKWADGEAATALDRAILKDADITIVTPGAGDMPLWARTGMGKVVSQFRSFSFAATNRMLYAGLQKNDLAVYNGIVLSVAMGTMAHIIKANLAGWPISYDADDLIANGLDRSGFLGSFMEINNMMEKVTGGRAGISALHGGTPMSRYASRDWIGAAVGPTFGTLSEMGKLAYGAAKGEISATETHSARKLLPYNNLWYMRWLFNSGENALNESLGIPKR